VWVEAELARVRLVLQPEVWRIMWGEGRLRGVDAVYEDFIQAGIGRDEVPVVRREIHRMAMELDGRSSGRHTRPLAGVLVKGRQFTQAAVLPYRNADGAPARPVRGRQHRAGLIEIEVARHHALGRRAVDLGKLTGAWVDRERGDVAGGCLAVVSPELVDRVEEALRRMHRHIARAFRLGREFGRRDLSGPAVL